MSIDIALCCLFYSYLAPALTKHNVENEVHTVTRTDMMEIMVKLVGWMLFFDDSCVLYCSYSVLTFAATDRHIFT